MKLENYLKNEKLYDRIKNVSGVIENIDQRKKPKWKYNDDYIHYLSIDGKTQTGEIEIIGERQKANGDLFKIAYPWEDIYFHLKINRYNHIEILWTCIIRGFVLDELHFMTREIQRLGNKRIYTDWKDYYDNNANRLKAINDKNRRRSIEGYRLFDD